MKDGGNEGREGHEKGGTHDSIFRWSSGTEGHIAALCTKTWSKSLNALDEGDERILEEVNENDKDAWCTLEERASEQLQVVISQQNKQKLNKDVRISGLSVENNPVHNS